MWPVVCIQWFAASGVHSQWFALSGLQPVVCSQWLCAQQCDCFPPLSSEDVPGIILHCSCRHGRVIGESEVIVHTLELRLLGVQEKLWTKLCTPGQPLSVSVTQCSEVPDILRDCVVTKTVQGGSE